MYLYTHIYFYMKTNVYKFIGMGKYTNLITCQAMNIKMYECNHINIYISSLKQSIEF